MASVTYDHVWKKFGDVTALNDLCIHVEDKEFLVLVGPSGCGKTTALRCLAGLEEVSEGDVLIGDQVVNDVAPKDRDIAMVFQSYAHRVGKNTPEQRRDAVLPWEPVGLSQPGTQETQKDEKDKEATPHFLHGNILA